MRINKKTIFYLLLLFIITIPAFMRIINGQYFPMHDDQHIARLYLFDQGILQGQLYLRWVGLLGFGFGYPLFNFYPPLIYFVGEVFHLLGFSLIWSVKLTFILGFYLSAVGIFLLIKKLTNRISAFLGATLYTYFFYHAVLIYVRGALAEFFSLAILPFLFLALINLSDKANLKNGIIFGILLALLILTHPLIAFPAVMFLFLFTTFYLLLIKNRWQFIKFLVIGGILGLGLSSFFWLPSFAERKYTLVDQILTKELASHNIHYIFPQQFIYSLWGFGGSGPGLSDGMTFQLGKIHIGLVVVSLVLSFISRLLPPTLRRGRNDKTLKYFYFFAFLLLFSLFMTTSYSSFIWDNVKYLWYLQFPWRFLTFTAVFISIVGSYVIFFLDRLLQQHIQPRVLDILLVGSIILFTIFTYQKYFKPQYLINTNDNERTSFKEIAWRISNTSYEFVPKGVKTKKSDLGTTVLDIDKKDLPKKAYEIISGNAYVRVLKDKFQEKEFMVMVDSKEPIVFRLNTYNFPGWSAYVDGNKSTINDQNDLKLIRLNIPSGQHDIRFKFEDTPVRKVGNIISTLSFLGTISYFLLFSRVKSVS